MSCSRLHRKIVALASALALLLASVASPIAQAQSQRHALAGEVCGAKGLAVGPEFAIVVPGKRGSDHANHVFECPCCSSIAHPAVAPRQADIVVADAGATAVFLPPQAAPRPRQAWRDIPVRAPPSFA
jgi:hypothetical protein